MAGFFEVALCLLVEGVLQGHVGGQAMMRQAMPRAATRIAIRRERRWVRTRVLQGMPRGSSCSSRRRVGAEEVRAEGAAVS